MERLLERAAACGIETKYVDGLGRRRRADPQVVARLLRAMTGEGETAARRLPRSIVVRGAGAAHLDVASPDGMPLRCFQGAAPADARLWGIAVQLYAVRSKRNWGHGDFTDLQRLIDQAADLGAAAVGINPLHALFEDRGEPSPYFPSSRLFLNPLYIDLDAVPEFGGVTRSDLERTIARLRGADMVAYAAVAAAKLGALRSAYRNFATSGSAERRDAFERFRQERGATLAKFAAFEFLRRKLGIPWPQWPLPWRRPDGPAVAELQKTHASELGYFAFVQWLAHEQLERCQARARARGLSIGLYLDVAVGVRPDGFDAWCDQDAILPEMSVGAPPDLLNGAGQDWGLAAFNPTALEARGFEPYRRMLQASMRYAGAIRIDHVLGLNRLFLVPAGASPADGLYVRYPLAALLAVTALASVETGCVVIGEDLGTVPKGFRSTMQDWGLWGYQVMLFERSRGGEFRPASRYRKDAVVTFATHDLPTFVGWWEARDLEARQRLGLKAGETRRQRQSARRALRNALPMSARERNDFAAVVKFLARAPSRLLMVSMEDLLGVADQVNMPGTVDAYPNWRRRLPVALEEFVNHERVSKVAGEMRSAGRSPAGHRETVGMPG